MSRRPLLLLVAIALLAGAALAQPGRGGSQWPTARGDAQRTSWIRTDDKISVAALSKPGFERQWTVKLEDQSSGLQGLAQGVTARGVTLFVPLSIVTGSSNAVYAIDNDIGYVVWQRQLDVGPPPAAPDCPGGITSAATRIVSLDASGAAAPPALGSGRGAIGYRSLLGEPGQGVPAEGRGRASGPVPGDPPGAKPAPAAAAPGAGRGAPPAQTGAVRDALSPPPQTGSGRGAQASERIPGAPPQDGRGGPYGFLFRPSGVVYVIASDGMLRVLGLPSGKDMQRPAPFLPANAAWSAPIAVGTTLYAATPGRCGSAPAAVWAIDLESEAKPVVSWKTNGGNVVGAVAFTSDGTLIAAIGPGQAAGDGKANAIVALDPETLQPKDWFTQPTAEFVTGPTILRHGGREVVAAATRDGRVLVLDAGSLGGADHATPLLASKPFLAPGGSVSGDALSAWHSTPAPALTAGSSAQPGDSDGTSWILLPVSGRVAGAAAAVNGAVTSGAVIALKLADTAGALSLEPAWISHDLASPAPPLIINGVVFALATGVPAAAAGRGTSAVLHAYEGTSGKRLWNSGKAMATWASPGSLWSSLGQVYVGTRDGTLHAFGFDDERSHVAR